jgi:hypothetical protein
MRRDEGKGPEGCRVVVVGDQKLTGSFTRRET